MQIDGKKIVVLGLGKSGVAAARYCAINGAQVVIADSATKDSLQQSISQLDDLKNIKLCVGGYSADNFQDADIIVVSPGVPIEQPEMKQSIIRGIPIVSEMELALHHCHRPIIAVTGTNGKSTTTALVGEMLKMAGNKVLVGGNIGIPMLELLGLTSPDAPRLTDEIVVLEVSSFQIDITPSLRPSTAILLNITPDHLDRYQNFDAYIESKAALINSMQASNKLIYNSNDPIAAQVAKGSRAQLIPFDVTFGEQKWNFNNRKIVGQHNLENLFAAGLAASVHGVSDQVIEEAGNSFAGLPHRCQLVCEWNGIKFYNDSKGTNPGAVQGTLGGFDQPVVLIAGGYNKKIDFSMLREVVRKRAANVVVMGESADALQAALHDVATITKVVTMQQAVEAAVNLAKSGDAIVLSPACASYDQYENYAQRGDDFVRIVKQITDKVEYATA